VIGVVSYIEIKMAKIITCSETIERSLKEKSKERTVRLIIGYKVDILG
jgi:hypothetical protein